LGKSSQVWTYRDATGETLFYVCRFDPHGERKQFLPLSLWRENGRLTWRWKAVPEPRPLWAARNDMAGCGRTGREIRGHSCWQPSPPRLRGLNHRRHGGMQTLFGKILAA